MPYDPFADRAGDPAPSDDFEIFTRSPASAEEGAKPASLPDQEIDLDALLAPESPLPYTAPGDGEERETQNAERGTESGMRSAENEDDEYEEDGARSGGLGGLIGKIGGSAKRIWGNVRGDGEERKTQNAERTTDDEEYEEDGGESGGKPGRGGVGNALRRMRKSVADDLRVMGGGSLRGLLGKLLRPAQLLRLSYRRWIPCAMVFAGLFFAGLYGMAALDWVRAGLISAGQAWGFAAVGFFTGGTAITLLCGVLRLASRWAKKDPQPVFLYAVPAAGAAVLPAVPVLLGLLIGWIFQTPVFVTLGVTALLWWIAQLLELARNLFRKRLFAVLAAVTVYGFIQFCWMTLTFGLK